MNSKTRVIGILAGDLVHQPDMHVKYGVFFDALAEHIDLVEVYDVNLQGVQRYWNALSVFHPSQHIWKERFFKNIPAFHARSRKVAAHLRNLSGRVDVVLQLGALFDATVANSGLPVVVYTDNTTQISARYPDAGRMNFSADELVRWTALEKQLYHRAAHVAVRSDLIRRSLMQDYALSDERISVIGGGVNFPLLPAQTDHVRTVDPVVLFIGYDFYRKGGDLVLRAFAKVRDRVPAARLILVTGQPIRSDLPLGNVEVLAPIWDRDAIAALYSRADIFVLPSRQETWGDVLLEAMAFGLPCIGVVGQSMESIIEDEVSGILVSPENVDALAQALEKLLEDPDLRYRMGQNSRKRIENKFTWADVVEQLLPVITS